MDDIHLTVLCSLIVEVVLHAFNTLDRMTAGRFTQPPGTLVPDWATIRQRINQFKTLVKISYLQRYEFFV